MDQQGMNQKLGVVISKNILLVFIPTLFFVQFGRYFGALGMRGVNCNNIDDFKTPNFFLPFSTLYFLHYFALRDKKIMTMNNNCPIGI